MKAAKYAPIGTRGTCGWVRANDSALIDFEEYSEWSDKNTMVWIIIENVDAVKNLDSILASGVDAVAAGGGDLARSMGLSKDHPDLVNALNHIAEVAKRKGVSVIGSCELDTPQKMLEEARLWKKNGARYILFPPDRNMLAANYRSIMSTFPNQKLL